MYDMTGFAGRRGTDVEVEEQLVTFGNLRSSTEVQSLAASALRRCLLLHPSMPYRYSSLYPWQVYVGS